MDTYANILLITIPIFLVLITIEILYGVWKKDQQHSFMDTISSLSSGFTNLLVDILGLGIIIFSYPFFYERLKIIDLEESIISPIAQVASLTIDTSGLTLHQLRDLVKNTIVPKVEQQMTILFESFGFKQRIPNGSDFVFDVRCLPNPYWKTELRTQTGHDSGVITFLESQVDVASMLADIIGYLTRWIPKFEANNRSYLTVSIGCTGGQHRSVYIANRLHEHFSQQYNFVQVMHKELATQ